MAGQVAESVVEALRICAGGIGGELGEPGAVLATPAMGPVEEGGAEAGTAGAGGDADRFDLEPGGTTARQRGHQGELHGGNEVPVLGADREQQLVLVAVDQREGLLVGLQVGGLAVVAEHVIGQQGDELGDVCHVGTVQSETAAGEIQGVHQAIVPGPAKLRLGRVTHNDSMASNTFLPGALRSTQLSFSDQAAWILKDEISGGWALQIGDAEQSHVDLEDPTHVVYEYLRRMANVLDEAWPRRQPLHIAHLGGGALTLARYMQATRPGSEQVVIEIERELPTLVTRALPLPEGTNLEVVIGDAREELAGMAGRRFDAIVLDVFSGEESPAHLATKDFYLEALSHLEDDGLLLVNVGDDSGQRFLAAQVRELEDASAEAGLSGVWTLTHASLLTTPADGNMVLLAGGALSSVDVEEWRTAWLKAGPHPAAVLDPAETIEAFHDRGHPQSR